MHNESASPMHDKLIQQGRAFFIVSLISLQLAAQYWEGSAPGGGHKWWVPGVTSAAAMVMLFIYHRRHPKVRHIVWLGILFLAMIWGGDALGSVGLPYLYFLVTGSIILVVAIVCCACILSGYLEKKLKTLMQKLDYGTSSLLLAGLFVTIIRTFADMVNAKVGNWATIPLVIVAVAVALVLTIDVTPRTVHPAVPRNAPPNTLFDECRRERLIRKTLRRLSQQRVRGILQPVNFWVIEKAVIDKSEDVTAALNTCLIRGWVEVLNSAVPHEELTPEGNLPEGPLGSRVAPVYRITESGWNIIHRSHEWILVTCAVAGATLLATIIGIFIKA